MLAATLGYIGWPRVAAAFGSKPTPRPPAYAAGDTVDVPAAWYSGTDTTLILFARASCTACQNAQPFLTRMVGAMTTRGDVVMAHPGETNEEDAQFAAGLGIKSDYVKAVPAGVRVRATPTVVIVNRQGRIIGAWEGVVKEENKAAILAAIGVTR
jgi:thioredoxin-related protein